MIKLRARSLKAVAVAAIGFLIAGVSVTAASASTAPTEQDVAAVCVPFAGQDYVAPTYEERVVTEAGWQRYSWTGGPWESDDAPAFPGDGGLWQANVAGDPHRIGVEGAYFDSHGNSGNGDWFYLEAIPAVTEMVMTDPGQEAMDPVVCEETESTPPPPVKIWVCKYVGTPGVDETLKNGNDGLIEVSENTLTGQEVTVGASFPDAHGRSLVVQIGGERPDISVCPVPTVEPVAVSMNLTYMTACAPDATNTWRIRNSSDIPVPYTLEYYGEGVVASGIAPVGDSFVNLPRETATAILKWGGGDTGIVAGSKTKASGVDEFCPIEITGVSVTAAEVPLCGPNNDPLNIPEVENMTFEDTGWIDNERTITAVPDEGYVIDGQSEWTFYDEATPCPVTTVAPTVSVICLPNNDTVTIPEVDGVVYTDSGWVNGERTITAAAAEDYSLTEGSVTSWTFIDVPVAGCPDEPPAFSYTPTGELAYTGASTGTNGLTALAIFLMATGTALVGLRVRAQQ